MLEKLKKTLGKIEKPAETVDPIPSLIYAQAKGSETADPYLPRVSVIVPIYNGQADVPDLIQCLLRQTYPVGRVEYLLVDNASTDTTASLLQAAAQAGEDEGIRLQALSEPQIQSSYAARNVGIRAATGEILVFTDADCRPTPEWLRHLVAPFADAQVGIVAGEIRALPGATLLERYAERKHVLSQKHTLRHPFAPYGQTANLAVRRQALAEVGLFRPYLTSGGDADLCWRILTQTTWQVRLMEQAVVYHRHRSTLKGLISQYRRYGGSNRQLHDLYGSGLTPPLAFHQSLYLISRWLLKEIPLAGLQVMRGRSDPLDWATTPLFLLTRWALHRGQQQATGSEAVDPVEWGSPHP
jgi:cellulose synthase/poly-beta-1,6-N-acetylglucosamine synthase-like glycosyltransferase